MENGIEKKKIINANTSVIDNNIIESPLFISSNKEIVTIGSLEKSSTVSNSVKRVLKLIKEDYDKGPEKIEYKKLPIVYRNWVDSKGMDRELLITSSIPDMSTMDVWNGLIGLYIQKLTPIMYDMTDNAYDLHTDEMKYTLYELAKFMNKSTGGKSLDKLMKEILRLKNATYFSFANGVIFDKKNDKYIKSKTKGLSLIVDCEFDSEKRVKDEKITTKCKVQFNRLIIDNIRYEYIKYINPKEYFALPSRGFTRRLYIYLKGNSHLSNGQKSKYIKRSYEVLKNKLPIYEKQPSKVKEKLKSPLMNLKKYGIISDYFFGDEVSINGKRDKSVYFIFDGTKEEIIDKMTIKQLEFNMKSEIEKENKFKFYIPNNVHDKLIGLGLSLSFVNEIMGKLDSWTIIKYILWVEEENTRRHIENVPGLLRYALISNQVNLSITHKHIEEYVEEEKKKASINKIDKETLNKIAYDEYLDDNINKMKKDEGAIYDLMVTNFLATLNKEVDERISQLDFLMKCEGIGKDELEKLNDQRQEWIDFNKTQENSIVFKRILRRELRLYLGLKEYEEFLKV